MSDTRTRELCPYHEAVEYIRIRSTKQIPIVYGSVTVRVCDDYSQRQRMIRAANLAFAGVRCSCDTTGRQQ